MEDAHQIGFLTEWQMYAQKIEGDSWLGEKLDQAKIDRMSGAYLFQGNGECTYPNEYRSTDRTTLRAHAIHTKKRQRRE